MPLDNFPRLGLGTVSDNPEEWRSVTQTALEIGYRHIDTAQMYGNERYVGEAIAESDVDREDIFLASKTVYPEAPSDPSGTYDAIVDSLDRLNVDYVDLFYVHWPSGAYEPEVVFPQFEKAMEEGKIGNIGVANFTPDLLDEARDVLDVSIAAHQVEYHPLLDQGELVSYAQEHDHWLVAYSPIARGAVFDIPEIRAVAEKHDVTPAQVSLAWLLSQDNVAAIPKSSSYDHLVENFEAAAVQLDEEDVARIGSINRSERIIDPDRGPWNW